jgi:hypothetical protein
MDAPKRKRSIPVRHLTDLPKASITIRSYGAPARMTFLSADWKHHLDFAGRFFKVANFLPHEDSTT